MSQQKITALMAIKETFHFSWKNRDVVFKALWLPIFFYLVIQLVSPHLPRGEGVSQVVSLLYIILSLIITAISFYLQAYFSVYWQRYILCKEVVKEAVVPPTFKREHGKYILYAVLMDILRQLIFASFIMKGLGLQPAGFALMLLLLFICYASIAVRLQFLGVQASLNQPLRFIESWRQTQPIWGTYFLSFCAVHFLFYGVLGVLGVGVLYLLGIKLSLESFLKYAALFNIIGLFAHVLFSYMACYFYKKTSKAIAK